VRKIAYILSIMVGVVLIVGGVATWIVVSNTLSDQKITVSDDASCLAGDEVNGPLSAYCEAKIIDEHALEATDGLRYAELDVRIRCARWLPMPRSYKPRSSPRWWHSVWPQWQS
jgi:hypothetical protein